MSCDLTKGRSKPCKTSAGGFSKFWIFKYDPTLVPLIVRDGQTLISYPASFIYKFEINRGTYSESQETGDGGKFWNQNIQVEMSDIDINEFQKLLKKDFGLVILDHNGNFRLVGLENGVVCDNLIQDTGSGHSDFSGTTLTFTGQEKDESLFFNTLDVGFIDPTEIQNYVFQNTKDNYVFQNDDNFIFN